MRLQINSFDSPNFCVIFQLGPGICTSVVALLQIDITNYGVHSVLCFPATTGDDAVGVECFDRWMGGNVCGVPVSLQSCVRSEVDDIGFLENIGGCRFWPCKGLSRLLPGLQHQLGVDRAFPRSVSIDSLQACVCSPWEATMVIKAEQQWRDHSLEECRACSWHVVTSTHSYLLKGCGYHYLQRVWQRCRR